MQTNYADVVENCKRCNGKRITYSHYIFKPVKHVAHGYYCPSCETLQEKASQQHSKAKLTHVLCDT